MTSWPYPGIAWVGWLAVLLSSASGARAGETPAERAGRGSVTDSAATRPTVADLQVIRERFLSSAVPPQGAGVATVLAAAREVARGAKGDGTFADVDYESGGRAKWGAAVHLEHALLLAKAAYLSHRDGMPEDDLAQKAAAALAWWAQQNPQNSNWWWNDIGAPTLLAETALYLGDRAPTEEMPKLEKILARPSWAKMTGQNLVWVTGNHILQGLIFNDPALVAEAYGRLYGEIRFTTQEGIQPDGSFHQHGAQFYSGGYGLAFSQDVTRFVGYAWGTPLQISAEKLAVLDTFLLGGQAWMTWGDVFDYSATGRELTRVGKLATTPNWEGSPISPVGRAYSLGNVVAHFAALPVPHAEEYRAWAEDLLETRRNAVNIGHKHFPYSDYTAHRRPNYFASLKMHSTRIVNTELVNGEGKWSHHLGDENLFLYLTGNEYKDIFPVWDWQKLPGTTAEQGDSITAVLGTTVGQRGQSAFVGGVSDGDYGASAMELVKGPLSARKAVFYFDDELVCLGAGITCDSDRDVVTTLNQCHVDGELTKASDGSWFHQGGVGYVVPGGQKVAVTTQPRTGAWRDFSDAGDAAPQTMPVFLATIDHGARVKDASYDFSILPGVSAVETERRAQSPEVEILANTEAVQAVRHKGLGLTMAVFYEPGKFGEIDVDTPCVVMLRNGKVSVAAPDHAVKHLTVRVGTKVLPLNVADGATVTR